MHYNCLIVDDEEELAKMTAEYFRMFDVSTEYVCSADCFSFFEGNSADLILLDINLGDGSGFDVCKKIREDLQLPILFISARQSDDDVLVALSIGGDDYVKKPYSLSVLLAKVKVNLKRYEQIRSAGSGTDQANGSGSGTADGNNADEAGDSRFRMDPGTMSVILNGNPVSLKAKEYALLDCL